MKYITREIKMYKYTFGKINVDNNTVYDLFERETPEQFSKREIGRICEESDGAVLLKTSIDTQKFAMPIARFVEECRAYNVAEIPAEDQDTGDTDAD